MGIVVNSTPTEEETVRREASRSGLAPDEFIRKLLRENLPPADPIEEMNRRIQVWQAEDHTPLLPLPAVSSGLSPTAALSTMKFCANYSDVRRSQK